MTALKWLLPLLLLVSQLAHAQQAPVPQGLVPDVSLPPDPVQPTPAQQTSPAQPSARAASAANVSNAAPPALAPPRTPQAAPTPPPNAPPVPTTQTTFPPGPYIQPPPSSLGAITVPAYPGTPPYRFDSPTELAEYGTWRVERLLARERGLRLLGRPPDYLAKRIGGFVALGAGVLTTVACVGYFLLNSTPNTSDNEARRDRAFGLLAASGLGLVLGAGVWLHYIKRDNPYRHEMAGLRREQREWLVEIKRARRSAKVRARMSFNLTRVRVEF